MRGIPIRPAAVVLAIMLAACDAIPAEQVRFYADSYSQANEAGNRLYDELVEPIRASKAGTVAPSAPVETQEFPARFVAAEFVALCAV